MGTWNILKCASTFLSLEDWRLSSLENRCSLCFRLFVFSGFWSPRLMFSSSPDDNASAQICFTAIICIYRTLRNQKSSYQWSSYLETSNTKLMANALCMWNISQLRPCTDSVTKPGDDWCATQSVGFSNQNQMKTREGKPDRFILGGGVGTYH